MGDLLFNLVQFGNNPLGGVDARELHAGLEVKSRFNDWIGNRLNDCQLVEKQDFIPLTKNLVSGGKTKEYTLSIEAAKHLAMMERNEIGKRVRQYFIEVEKRARQIAEKVAADEALKREALALLCGKDATAWEKTFPDEFYHELYRLLGWGVKAPADHRMPGYVGKCTNKIVYDRIHEHLAERLRPLAGENNCKMHQMLSSDVGRLLLHDRLSTIVNIMRQADNMAHLLVLLDTFMPPRFGQQALPLTGVITITAQIQFGERDAQ